MNDFQSTGANGGNEAAPEPHAADASAHAQGRDYASTLAALRASIQALSPDDIAEISRRARVPRGKITEFCEQGVDPFSTSKLADLVVAVSAFEAARAAGNAPETADEPEPGASTRADTSAGTASGGFRATWARTASNARISKIQTPSGPWQTTPGVKSKSYVFEVREYPDVEAFYADYEARQKSGIWALIAGELRPDIDPGKPHRRVGTNFIDAASTKLTIDFDGLAPDNADTPIDGADAYGGDNCEGDAVSVALARLPKAFGQAACMVSATSSTGWKIVSTGKPSEGKARFRGTWETSRALTCGQQEKLAKTLKTILGLGCIDGGFYTLEHFEFIARPVFLPGQTDPVKNPVYLLEGELLDIDAVCAELGIDLGAAASSGGGSKARPRPRGPSPGSGRPLTPEEAKALYLAHKQANPLLHALADSVVNGPWFERPHWIGYAHTMLNVFGRDVGWMKFSEFSKRRISADGHPRANDPNVDKLAFNTLQDSQNDIVDLAGYAREHGGEAGRAAYYDFVFPDLTPEEEALLDGMLGGASQKPADAHRGGIWAEWRAAIERLRAARPAPMFGAGGWTPHPSFPNVLTLDDEDVAPVPLRPEMTDRHTRGEVSMLVGSPGVGKSTIGTSYAVATAYENPAVIGQSSIDWCGDVVIVSNEEDNQTARRRIRALERDRGLSRKDQKHRVRVWGETLVLGQAIGSDGVAPARAAIAFINTLADLNAESEIALVVLDTLASMFSGINENSAEMDKAIGMIAEIARAGFFAIDIMHHNAKAEDGKETANSYRGSTSIAGKVREHSTLVFVPQKEWAGFGWSEDEGARTVRIKGQKANDKPHAGAWGFRREFPRLGAYDVRNPSDLKSASIGILVPLGALKPKQDQTQKALRVLYDAHQAGASITRGGGIGSPASHHAHRFLIDAGLGDRKAVEEILIKLIKSGLVMTKPGKVNANAVTLLIPNEPEEEV